MVNFFEGFRKPKTSGTDGEGGSGGSPAGKISKIETKPASPNVPDRKLPGQESPFAAAIKDCARPAEQKRKVEGMSEQEAFQYISGDEMAVLYAFLGKMRPDTFVFLLEKLSRDHLKTVFEDIKKTNSLRLLTSVGEKDSTLVPRLIELRIKSGVNFNESASGVNSSVNHPDEGLESVGIEIEKKIAKEMLKKIEDLRAELMEYGYEVTPTQVDGKETIADLGELAKIILDADEFINFRYNRQKGDLEAEKKVGYHDEFKGGGYEIIYDKKGVELADTNEEILAQVRIEARTKMVFNSFRKYLLAKYPERFPKLEEEPEKSLDKKGTE